MRTQENNKPSLCFCDACIQGRRTITHALTSSQSSKEPVPPSESIPDGLEFTGGMKEEEEEEEEKGKRRKEPGDEEGEKE